MLKLKVNGLCSISDPIIIDCCTKKVIICVKNINFRVKIGLTSGIFQGRLMYLGIISLVRGTFSCKTSILLMIRHRLALNVGLPYIWFPYRDMHHIYH